MLGIVTFNVLVLFIDLVVFRDLVVFIDLIVFRDLVVFIDLAVFRDLVVFITLVLFNNFTELGLFSSLLLDSFMPKLPSLVLDVLLFKSVTLHWFLA